MKYDGMSKENALKFQKTKVVEKMFTIDPGTGSNDLEGPPNTPDAADGEYVAMAPDVEDVADLSSLPSFGVAKELIHDGRAPLTGWRRDHFPPDGPVVRCTVWTPPYSLRLPDVEPEQWLSLK